MLEISTETLAALYPFESRRMIKNYASFIEDNPDWVESGNSLLDYKRSKVLPEFSLCPSAKKQPQGRHA